MLRFEKEIRGQWPDDRPSKVVITDASQPTKKQKETTTKQASPQLKERLGPCCTTAPRQHHQASVSSDNTSDEGQFHRYSDHKIMDRASIDGAPKQMSAIDFKLHRTENHRGYACAKVGHTEKQC